MKKLLIAAAAIATLAAGASAAQAKVNVDFNIGFPGVYVGGYPTYEPVGYYGYEPDCHYVTVKKVKWVDGHKVVKLKKKLICD
jgi:opacity protein-like surface antigen